jgi:hypothetical protein
MNVEKILKELYDERDAIDQALLALERLLLAKGEKRRGRPPNWLKRAQSEADDPDPPKTPRGRPKS